MRSRAATLLAGLLLAEIASPLRGEELAVIVHPTRDVRLDVDALAQIYLKQRRRWPNGEHIVPVNRELDSPERAQFASAVLGQTPQQLAIYWNREYFHGVQPPATLASDEAVKRFVASEPRAIGYVRASALDASVRVVLRLPEPVLPP
jgi:ABC-type phosphate transport system substrate-binding protein